MTGDTRLFTLLQHGDSFFPGGLTSFSWGLEQLFEEKRVTDADGLIRFIEAELRFRWGSFDHAFLSASYRAAGDLPIVATVDRLCQVSMAARELREGSIRAGQALLAVHAKLGTPGAQSYRELTLRNEAKGHLSVVQGLLWRALGFSETETGEISAYSLVVGLAAAAIRLGLIGHLDAQKTIASMAAVVEDIVTRPAPELDDAAAFTPATEIASMRHESAEQRLFAN
jgi:urease accessory protein